MGTYTSQTKQKVRIVVTAFAVFFFSLERALLSSLLTTGGQLMLGAGLNPNF